MKTKIYQFVQQHKTQLIKAIGGIVVGFIIFLCSCSSVQRIQIEQQNGDSQKQSTVIESDVKWRSVALSITPTNIEYRGN